MELFTRLHWHDFNEKIQHDKPILESLLHTGFKPFVELFGLVLLCCSSNSIFHSPGQTLIWKTCEHPSCIICRPTDAGKWSRKWCSTQLCLTSWSKLLLSQKWRNRPSREEISVACRFIACRSKGIWREQYIHLWQNPSLSAVCHISYWQLHSFHSVTLVGSWIWRETDVRLEK